MVFLGGGGGGGGGGVVRGQELPGKNSSELNFLKMMEEMDETCVSVGEKMNWIFLPLVFFSSLVSRA